MSKKHANLTVSANLRGGPLAPGLTGTVLFKSVPGGTQVVAEVRGLPAYQPAQGDRPPIGPHGFHIHQNGDCCVGDPYDPFQAAGGHWNPDNQPHGNHAATFLYSSPTTVTQLWPFLLIVSTHRTSSGNP